MEIVNSTQNSNILKTNIFDFYKINDINSENIIFRWNDIAEIKKYDFTDKKIKRENSFLLMRTNPKLTTNIKLVADSTNNIFLESIDADPILSKSIYKRYKINGNGNYSFDINKFYNQNLGLLSTDISYKLFQKDNSTLIKNKYKDQFDFTYCYGTSIKNSRLYTEELSMFAPIWLEPKSVPDYFIIFKLEEPNTTNINSTEIKEKYPNSNFDTLNELDDLVTNPKYFFENVIKKAKIVKTFDLSNKTELGKYIRNHVSNSNFSKCPLYANLQKNKNLIYNGISYNEGGFTEAKDNIYNNYVITDKTVLEFDSVITNGFKKNNIILPNILNIEFLFDDKDTDKYRFNRYFGLYINELEMGQFLIDENRLFEDREIERTQLPSPIKPNVGIASNVINQNQTNEKGIKIYPKLKKIFNTQNIIDYFIQEEIKKQSPQSLSLLINFFLSGLNKKIKFSPTIFGNSLAKLATGMKIKIAIDDAGQKLISGKSDAKKIEFENYEIYNGRLISFIELLQPLFGYVKDTKNNFYLLNNENDWSVKKDENKTTIIDNFYLRVKDKKVDWYNFSGFENPHNYIPVNITKETGRSVMSFKVISNFINGDEIRIKYTDTTNLNDIKYINKFTIRAVSDNIAIGDAKLNMFNPNGTLNDVAKSISIAINNMSNNNNQIFKSIVKNNIVIVFTRNKSENYNNISYSIFSSAKNCPFEQYNKYKNIEYKENYYQQVPYNESNVKLSGWYFMDTFLGGNNNPKSRLIVKTEQILEFIDEKDDIYIKTKKGYDTISNYSLYVDEPIYNKQGDIIDFNNINTYSILNLSDTANEITLSTSLKLPIYKLAKNKVGYFSILPIKDFDFDYHSTEYNKDADSNINKLYEYYTDRFNFILNDSKYEGKENPFDVFKPDCFFIQNGGFSKLNKNFDNLNIDLYEDINNEYDRLKENDHPNLSITSRITPFINKWVYEDYNTDVRENNYRLNNNQAFGIQGFTPSFDEKSINPALYTHEWYYLQQYPPYMTFDEKLNSYSYFNENIKYVDIFPNINTDKSYYLDLINSEVKTSTSALSNNIGSLNSINVFDSNTNKYKNLYNINYDYFSSYFIQDSIVVEEEVESKVISVNENNTNNNSQVIISKPKSLTPSLNQKVYKKIPVKHKYSIFKHGSNTRYSETLFRGVKVLLKERLENSNLNYNINNIKFNLSNKYNNYKFSCILTDNETDNIICIKNDKWKTVTLIIQYNFNNDFRLKINALKNSRTEPDIYFIDRLHLYALKSSFNYILLDSPLANIYTDKILNGSVYSNKNPYIWKANNIENCYEVYGGFDLNGNYSNFINEINTDIECKVDNKINLKTKEVNKHYYKFIDVYDIKSNSFKCKQIQLIKIHNNNEFELYTLPNNNEYSESTSLKPLEILKPNEQIIINNITYNKFTTIVYDSLKSKLVQENGGYNIFKNTLSDISFANIAHKINNGDSSIKYLNVTENGDILENTYILELLKPETVAKSTYIKYENTKSKPTSVGVGKTSNLIGYDLKLEKTLNISYLNRVYGGFKPKVKDVFKFIDTDSLDLYGLDKLNILFLTDIGYMKDNTFGIINNLYYNKVNIDNKNIILLPNSEERFIYPKISEIAIDYDDFYMFRSRWDVFYYKNYLKSNLFETKVGTRETKQDKSFMASKILSLPNEIRIDNINTEILNVTDLNNNNFINKDTYNILKFEKSNKDVNTVILRFFGNYILYNYLIQDGISTEFIKYLNKDYLFDIVQNNSDNLTEYIKQYIFDNIINRYYIKEVKLYEKIYNKGNEIKIYNIDLNLIDKLQLNYEESKNFKMILDSNKLDFDIIYNKRNDKNVSISFSILLEKK